MKLIDIHAHLQFEQFDADRVEVIARAREAGVGVINVGTDLKTSKEAVKLAENNSQMWATVGIHPTDIPEPDKLTETIAELKKLASLSEVVAVGECGLDYGRNPKHEALNPKQIQNQKEILKKQIEIALAVKKPLMIHCRNAYQDLYNFLVSDFDIRNSDLAANVHFFAGTWAEAKQFLDLGFSLSFTGVITFARDYDEVIKNTPQDRIMIETDCPFVAPAPYRGKRNEPFYVLEVLKKMAQIRGEDEENLRQAVLANACRFFGLLL